MCPIWVCLDRNWNECPNNLYKGLYADANSYDDITGDWSKAKELGERIQDGVRHALTPVGPTQKAVDESPGINAQDVQYVTPSDTPLIVQLEKTKRKYDVHGLGLHSVGSTEVRIPPFIDSALSFLEITRVEGTRDRITQVTKSTAVIGRIPGVDEFLIINEFLVHKDALQTGCPGPFPPVHVLFFDDPDFVSFFSLHRLPPKFWKNTSKRNISKEYGRRMLQLHKDLKAAFPLFKETTIYPRYFNFDLNCIKYKFNRLTALAHKSPPKVTSFLVKSARDPFSINYEEKHNPLEILTRRLAGTMKPEKKNLIDEAQRYERLNSTRDDNWQPSYQAQSDFSDQIHIPNTSRLKNENDDEDNRIYLLQDGGKYAWKTFLKEKNYPDIANRTGAKFSRNLLKGVTLVPKIVHHPGYFLLTTNMLAQSSYRFQLVLAAVERMLEQCSSANFDPDVVSQNFATLNQMLVFLSAGSDTNMMEYKRITQEIKSLPVQKLPVMTPLLNEVARQHLSFPLDTSSNFKHGRIDNGKITDKHFAYMTKREVQTKFCKHKQNELNSFAALKRKHLLSENKDVFRRAANEETAHIYSTLDRQNLKKEKQKSELKGLRDALQTGATVTKHGGNNHEFDKLARDLVGKKADVLRLAKTVQEGNTSTKVESFQPPPRRAGNY